MTEKANIFTGWPEDGQPQATKRRISMREFKLNELAAEFDMRPLSPAEQGCYAGVEGEAWIANTELLNAVYADLVIDDATMQIHYVDEEDQPRSFEWGRKFSRFERELMACLVLTMATEPVFGLSPVTLTSLGWEQIV